MTSESSEAPFKIEVCSAGPFRNPAVFRLKAVLRTIKTGFNTHSNGSATTVSPTATGLVVEGQIRRCRRLRFWILISPLLILLAIGCKGQQGQNAQNAASTPDSGTTLVPPGAAPREVAEAALTAIRDRDTEALTSLIAVKKVKQDIEAIARGRAAFQGMVDNAIPTTVAAIAFEINGLDADGREIEQETITGTTALVTVKGKQNGKEQTRRLFLVQEDGQWRLVPSHR